MRENTTSNHYVCIRKRGVCSKSIETLIQNWSELMSVFDLVNPSLTRMPHLSVIFEFIWVFQLSTLHHSFSFYFISLFFGTQFKVYLFHMLKILLPKLSGTCDVYTSYHNNHTNIRASNVDLISDEEMWLIWSEHTHSNEHRVTIYGPCSFHSFQCSCFSTVWIFSARSF